MKAPTPRGLTPIGPIPRGPVPDRPTISGPTPIRTSLCEPKPPARSPLAARLLLIMAGVAVLASCDPSRVYEKNVRIPDGIWHSDKPVYFEVQVEDTLSPHNLYINVRNTSLYPYSNLYLFVTTTAPSGDFVRDTVDVILADHKGKWKGKGLGDIWDLQQLYKRDVRFAQRGTYHFEYRQAMRMDKLPFILDVGLRVEKAD